ncbi:MAG: hypothetical protein ACP5XB_24875 [Isosphaeraceae bacterium]
MSLPEIDHRTSARQALDEKIAAEPPLPAPELSAAARPASMEAHLGRLRKPLAVAGVVEHGVVRPLDPTVTLPEHSRVIIVATDAT